MDNNNKKLEKAKKSLQLMSNKKTPKLVWKWGEALSIYMESDDYQQWKENSLFRKEGILERKFNLVKSLISYQEYQYFCLFYTYLSEEIPEVDITVQYAVRYLRIYERIDEEDVNNNPNILVSFLYQLIEIDDENVRKNFIKAFSEVEKSYKNTASAKKRTLWYLYTKDGNDYLEKIISNINCSDKKKNFSVSDITKIILNDYIKPRINELEKSTKHKNTQKSKPELGTIDLKTDHFLDLKELHPKQPITEQGLVGLFCTMFHLLKKFKFSLPEQYGVLQFSKIIYIREEFPDAKIDFKIYDNETQKYETGNQQLDIEFEYQSQKYIEHKHHFQGRCDLIICWEDNWSSPMSYCPRLSLKDLLETGKVNISYH